MMTVSERAGSLARGGILTTLVLVLSLSPPALCQRLDFETSVFAGQARLDRPADLAVSPGGEQVAVSDPIANRIAVIDFDGRPLWSAGDEADLGRPKAVCFLDENQILYSQSDSPRVLTVTRDNPGVIDTVADLTTVLEPEQRLDRIIRLADSSFYVLDAGRGEVLHFGPDWNYIETVVPQGSGKGRVLVPTDIAVTTDGRLFVTDRKNYPCQAFSPQGKYLFSFGWTHPGAERGWEATAVAVDARQVVWIADETGATYRLFDQSGAQISSLPFANPVVRPIAMASMIDNRMLVLEEAGRVLFYTLDQ
jgi:DNA-binding beta-propeller fold protein YncE